MKVWLDDIRPAPEGYIWIKSVNEAKNFILSQERKYVDRLNETKEFDTSLLARYWDMDHDAGEYAMDGGDYIELLNWLEKTARVNYTFRIHSHNPVGVENMRRIIAKNSIRNWEEVK